MPNPYSHMSQPKKERRNTRHFWASHVAGWLLLWLNSNRGSPAYKRVENLLRQISEYLKAVDAYRLTHRDDPSGLTVWGGRIVEGSWDFPSFSREIDAAAEAIQNSLRRYKLRPELVRGKDRRLLFDWEPAEAKEYNSSERIGNQIRFTESHAIARIVELGQEGLIDRVKECPNCDTWFCAKFSHEKFCQPSCQQKFYRADPKWKRQRNAYMKRLRALHKDRVFK
jgi:hypothetical protein